MNDKQHYREQIGELCTIYQDTLNRGHGVITRFEQGNRAAEKILAAGYRKPRTITTAEELDALPYGTAVAHDEGWGVTIAQRQAEDMRWYVTGCLEYIRPEALLPATVLYEPQP